MSDEVVADKIRKVSFALIFSWESVIVWSVDQPPTEDIQNVEQNRAGSRGGRSIVWNLGTSGAVDKPPALSDEDENCFGLRYCGA